jgi:hypothetical protein
LRQSDLKNYEADLAGENESFSDATDAYNDIRLQLERETAVANDALALVSNAGFAASLSKNGV